MDPRRLHLLRAVALAGTVAGAARALHITAPAVSQQLALLEREAGTTLLHRSRSGVVLTAAGERLAMRAERIEQELAGARRDLAELTGQSQGRVRLAVFNSVLTRLIVPALELAAAQDPGVQIEVIETHGPTIGERLRSGELDAAIVERDDSESPPRRPGLQHVPLMFDAYRVVVPASWHIEPTSLADLAGRQWISGPPGTACDVALRRQVDRAAIRDVCVEFPTMLGLVAAGRGAALAPQIALGHPGTVTCPGIDVGARELLVAHRRTVEPPVRAIVRALIRAARDPQDRDDHDARGAKRRRS